jgi:hypothetical protein
MTWFEYLQMEKIVVFDLTLSQGATSPIGATIEDDPTVHVATATLTFLKPVSHLIDGIRQFHMDWDWSFP